MTNPGRSAKRGRLRAGTDAFTAGWKDRTVSQHAAFN
jgi:hypothetical protein